LLLLQALTERVTFMREIEMQRPPSQLSGAALTRRYRDKATSRHPLRLAPSLSGRQGVEVEHRGAGFVLKPPLDCG